MTTDDSLFHARQAVEEVQRRIGVLSAQREDSLAMRRLCLDAKRLAEDLAELSPPAAQGPARVLEIVPDADYAPGFWGDAEDEGLGHPR